MMFLLDATVPQRDPTLQWALIVLALVTIFYVTVIRPNAKKKRDPLAKSLSASSLSQQRNVERQMQNLLVELSEMARQITAQLDTRTQKLQMLIQDADERIAAMQQANRQPVEPIVTTSWNNPVEPVTRIEQPQEPVDEQHQQVYTLADQGRSAMDISRELNRPRGEVELILALRS
jgi:hypothetical protein